MTTQNTDPTKKFGSFTNAIGETYVVHGLSPLFPQKLLDTVKDEWVKAGKALPKIPTYTVDLVTGEKEVHEHNPGSLVVEGDPEQTKINQDNWREYSQNNDLIQGEFNSRLLKAIFLAVVATPTDEWRQEMEFLGVKIPPKNSPAEKYFYIENRVIQNQQDIMNLMVAVFRLTGVVSEAVVAEVEATFRSSLQEQTNRASSKAHATGRLEGQ